MNAEVLQNFQGILGGDDVKEEYGRHTLCMAELMQVLVGSPHLPRNIDNGLIVFDNIGRTLSSVNTCAPTLTITTKRVATYEDLLLEMLNICINSPGFTMK